MIYYIDPSVVIDGDGLSLESPKKNYRDITPLPGDKLLFKRGSFIRDTLDRKPGTPEARITYGAYGEGTNPVFCGSVDVSSPDDWKEVRQNVWRYTGKTETEACNFIFDGGRMGATLRWDETQLVSQGDWNDNRFGSKERRFEIDDPCVLLYSKGNPGEVYSHIECVVWGKRCMSTNRDCTTLEDIIFYGSGVHGIAGGASHMTVRRCSFIFIGGSVWNPNLRIRFGNGIEFWDRGEDILIEDCYFNNIYDSAITHQGAANCLPAKNLIMRRNLFINYSMGAYEGRDRMSIDSAFNDNICINAGGGFGSFGDTTPRNSEIFPQPMGHHLFMWRIPKATDGGSLEIVRNKFYNATGAAMYSIISPEAEAQMKLSDNVYFTNNASLFNRMKGKNYRPDEFDKYISECGETGAKYESFDVKAEAEKWFETTGCGRFTEKLFTDKLPSRVYFVGSTEKNSLEYKKGEKMKFVLRLESADGAELPKVRFAYERYGDDGLTDKGMTELSDVFEYTTSIAVSGFVRLIVRACDENGKVIEGYEDFEGGACAGIEEIKQSGSIPDDFDEFWDRVIREELDPVAPTELERVPFHCGDPGSVVFDMKIACPGENPVSGYLRLPKDAKENSLPIVVSFMGYGVDSAPIPSLGNSIQLSINPHGIINGQTPKFYRDLRATELAGFGFKNDENKNPDTVYFKYMVLRAIQAVRYCKTLPEWDGKNIRLNGGSMAAMQATSVAAHEPGITELNISIPWLCDLRAIEYGRQRGWRPDPADGLDYYDTVCQASRVNCNVTISAGLGDYVCPPSGEVALYKSFNCPVKMVFLQNRKHGYSAPRCEQYRM